MNGQLTAEAAISKDTLLQLSNVFANARVAEIGDSHTYLRVHCHYRCTAEKNVLRKRAGVPFSLGL